jgi:hypothetical protein
MFIELAFYDPSFIPEAVNPKLKRQAAIHNRRCWMA